MIQFPFKKPFDVMSQRVITRPWGDPFVEAHQGMGIILVKHQQTTVFFI